MDLSEFCAAWPLGKVWSIIHVAGPTGTAPSSSTSESSAQPGLQGGTGSSSMYLDQQGQPHPAAHQRVLHRLASGEGPVIIHVPGPIGTATSSGTMRGRQV